MEVITICSHCNCIKGPGGKWLHNVKIRQGKKDSDFDISHSVCDECLPKYYPEQAKIMKEENDIKNSNLEDINSNTK